MDQDDQSDGYQWALEHGERKSEEVYSFLGEYSSYLSQILNFDIFIGKDTGFDSCHEFCIFFEAGTPSDIISNTIKMYEGDIYPKAQEKWRSFLDII